MELALLRSPTGEAALAAARPLVAAQEPALRALEALRSVYGAELAAAAWTQELLRVRAAAKFGAEAAQMLFTPDGLEQATRAPVAAHRAQRLVGRRSVVDLGCGIGGDLRAFAALEPALEVVGVDRSAEAAECAAFNVPTARVEVADALELGLDFALDSFDVVFADPARRTSRGRVFRPADYSPPWAWLESLLVSCDAAAKVAPGIPHDLVPAGVEAEWVSWNGEVKEAALWSGSLATPGVRRRATVLRPLMTAALGGAITSHSDSLVTAAPSAAIISADDLTTHTLVGVDAAVAAGPLGRWLHEPDGAVIRAGLVAEAAALIDGRLLDTTIAYVTTDSDAQSPYTRRWEVLEALPFSLKRLRAALHVRNIGRLDVKKRGTAVEPEQLRKDLKLRGDEHAVVVLTRIAGEHWAVICAP